MSIKIRRPDGMTIELVKCDNCGHRRYWEPLRKLQGKPCRCPCHMR